MNQEVSPKSGLIKKRGVLIAIVVVIALAAVGGVVYYWWTGTPEYSLHQLRKAVAEHNAELGMKYIDKDTLFENIWEDTKNQITEEAASSQEDGLEGLGTMLGLSMIENMKPSVRSEFDDAIDGWFEEQEEAGVLQRGVENKVNEIQKEGDKAYIDIGDEVKLVLTRKEGERCWAITDIENFENINEGLSGGEGDIIEKEVGDEIDFANIKFKVNGVEEQQALSTSYGTTINAKSGSKFVVLDVDVTNITNEDYYFSSQTVKLTDDKGREYDGYSDAWSVQNFLPQDLAPSISESGVMVYEVPSDSQEYSISIAKQGTSEVYKINLQ